MKTFALLALVACSPAAVAPPPVAAPAAPSSPITDVQLAALAPRYFAALAGDGTAMETELAAFVARALTDDDADRIAPADRERVGLLFVYDALLVGRDGPTDPARRARAVDLLQRAHRLRPADRRIESWVAGAQVAYARAVGDHAAEATGVQQLLDAIDAEPTFNLWTAFIVLRDEPAGSDRFAALFAKAAAFVQSGRCRDVTPGSVDARNCKSGPLAPHNTQAAVVMLADPFLRRGEQLLHDGRVGDAMPILGTAAGILHTLSTDDNRAATDAWSARAAYVARVARLTQAMHSQAVVPDRLDNDAVYACTACHAP